MRRMAVASMICVAPTSVPAATDGEVFAAVIDYVRAECAEAFEAHEALWPDEDSGLSVAWQVLADRNSDRETRLPLPLDAELTRVLAWNTSNYALIDDLVFVVSYANRDEPPPAEWIERYRRLAQRLGAAVDVYNCLRPTDQEFAVFEAAGGAKELTGYAVSMDCLASVAGRMASIFRDFEGDAIHANLQPLRLEREQCERVNR